MSIIIKQNFTLPCVRALMDDILSQELYKTYCKEAQADLKSLLTNFASRVWKQAHKSSIIAAKQANQNQDDSWNGENSFLQALQIDQRNLRNNLLLKDRQIQFFKQECRENKQVVDQQANLIKQMKSTIATLSKAYEEAKLIFYEEIHKRGETELMTVNQTESLEPKKMEVYELSYQLSTAQRSMNCLRDKLEVTGQQLMAKERRQKQQEGKSMIQKNDIKRMEKKIEILEQANLMKKQKIEELLQLLGNPPQK